MNVMTAADGIHGGGGAGERTGRRRPRWTASTEWAIARLRARRPSPPGRMSAPAVALTGAMAMWFGIFATLVVQRHQRYGTYDHDLGIWDQAVWLLAHGQSFNTVRGLDVFGFHVSPALYLFAPLSWLGAGPDVLNLAMLAAIAAGAVAVYRIACHHLRRTWQALVLALAFLVNYALQSMVWETFHPEVIAIAPLLFAYLAAVEGRWRAYAAWAVLALLWKEDVALAVAMMGVVLVIRGRRTVGSWAAARHGAVVRTGPSGTRLAGLLTIAGAVVWFVVATRVVIPWASPEGGFTDALFGDLGSSPAEIAQTAITQPHIVGEHLGRSNPIRYAGELTGSFGFVPLLSPAALLIGLPQLLINELAIYDFFWTTRVHYAALPLFATTIAAVEGVARVHGRRLRRLLVGAVAAGMLFTGVAWGVSPVSPEFRGGYWKLSSDPEREALLDHAVALPGPDDAVSATYNLVPHLTHRSAAYTFPNPWRPESWGVRDENRPDPATVDWLIVDPTASSATWPILLHAVSDPDTPLGADAPLSAAGPGPGARAELAARIDTDRWVVVVDEPHLLALRRAPR